jgi:hypothetical protein
MLALLALLVLGAVAAPAEKPVRGACTPCELQRRQGGGEEGRPAFALHARMHPRHACRLPSLQDLHAPLYVVMIDAGSSGSRVHVYSYRPPARPGKYAPVTLPEAQMRISPGLSAYAMEHDTAGASLEPLLEFARRSVPAELHGRTPLRLMATAGLRMLPPERAEAVLESCRGRLAASGFLFEPVSCCPYSLPGKAPAYIPPGTAHLH